MERRELLGRRVLNFLLFDIGLMMRCRLLSHAPPARCGTEADCVRTGRSRAGGCTNRQVRSGRASHHLLQASPSLSYRTLSNVRLQKRVQAWEQDGRRPPSRLVRSSVSSPSSRLTGLILRGRRLRVGTTVCSDEGLPTCGSSVRYHYSGERRPSERE